MSEPSAYTLVRHPDRPAVLLVPDGDGWSLPGHDGSWATDVLGDLRREYGLDVIVLGRYREFFDGRRVQYVYLCEAAAKSETATGGARWFEPSEWPDLTIPSDRTSSILTAWADRRARGGASMSDTPWSSPGWLDEAAGWITERIQVTGAAVTGPVEQFVSAPYSCTLRMPTDQGLVYFKASPDAFAHEPLLMAALHEWHPDSVPPVLAVDRARHWMLTRDVAPTFIEDVAAEIDNYCAAIAQYARMQHAAVARVDEILALGVPDRRLHVLPDQFAELVADRSALLLDDEFGLSPTEYAQLERYVPEFRRACERLAELGLPETLQNTDFWRDCIAVTGHGFAFLDWAESIVGHPLFALTMVLRDPALAGLADADALTRRVKDTYFAEWTAYATADQLEEAHERARPAGIVCRAMAWRDCVSTLDDPSRYPMLRSTIARNMRALLAMVGAADR